MKKAGGVSVAYMLVTALSVQAQEYRILYDIYQCRDTAVYEAAVQLAERDSPETVRAYLEHAPSCVRLGRELYRGAFGWRRADQQRLAAAKLLPVPFLLLTYTAVDL